MMRDAVEYCAYAALIALVSALGHAWHINATTAALTFLLVVLAAATFSGLVKATVTSLFSVLAFNYFFLPPIGTLTIQDPQNWIAFTAFFITAITASQFSGRAQGKAHEARRQRLETERLYELSRAILVDESPSRTESMALGHLVRIFKVRQAQFFVTGEELPPAPIEEDLVRAAQAKAAPLREGEWLIVPVQLGGRPAGTLLLELRGSGQLTDAVAGAIGNLIAIGFERRSSFERVAAAEAARRSDELRTALLDGLAHDLKTPLSAIKTSATVLLEHEQRLDHSDRELIAIISEEAERLQDTVAEALETGRVESGKFELRKASCMVTELLDDLRRHRESYERRLRVHFVPDGPVPERLSIKADRDLVEMALRQIVDNAIRYSPDREPVEVDVASDAQTVSISIQDAGPGIPESERPFVFDKFFQGTTGKAVAGGSGLGLAVAKRVIEAHGGSISLAATERGSRFVVRMERESV
jgi:two-component system sensor histidine kinase KdpD